MEGMVSPVIRVAVDLILCISEYASATSVMVKKMAVAPNPTEMRVLFFEAFISVFGSAAIPNVSARFIGP
jgi:hypothetical protein